MAILQRFVINKMKYVMNHIFYNRSGADPVFPRGGANLLFSQIYLKMKIGLGRVCKILLCRSATEKSFHMSFVAYYLCSYFCTLF